MKLYVLFHFDSCPPSPPQPPVELLLSGTTLPLFPSTFLPRERRDPLWWRTLPRRCLLLNTCHCDVRHTPNKSLGLLWRRSLCFRLSLGFFQCVLRYRLMRWIWETCLTAWKQIYVRGRTLLHFVDRWLEPVTSLLRYLFFDTPTGQNVGKLIS